MPGCGKLARLPARRLPARRLGAPGIIPLESAVEIVDTGEVVAGVVRLAHQEPELHEREDDVTNVRRRTDAPVLEDRSRHDTIAVEREVAAPLGQLLAADVPAFGERGLAVLEGGEDEQ